MKILILILLVFSVNCLYSQFTQTVVSISGEVSNEIDNTPLKGWVIVTDSEGKIVTKSRSNGKYFITGLKPGEVYNIEVDTKGFFKNNFELAVPNTDKYSELSRDFVMKPMEVGAKIPLSVIPFDIRHTKLRNGADIFLDDFVAIMRSNPRASFSIEVYPENPNNTNNLDFTNKRAEELKAFFEENRVRSEILIKANSTIDAKNPPPSGKQAKGKRYKGSIYLVVNKI